MNPYQPPLDWLSAQKEIMVSLLVKWVDINSGTENLEGLDRMFRAISESFKVFEETIEPLALETGTSWDMKGNLHKTHFGHALRIVKRPEAPIQILLCGHMDTVFSKNSPFQNAERHKDDTLKGPGAADMKGGLIIMLKALEAFEKFQHRDQIGWEVIINSDEEVGSVGSEALIRKSCMGKHLGLIFEPSFPDGYLVSERKGSMNFTILSKGISAHAGRDFHKGRNAITHLLQILVKLEQLNGEREGLTINLGSIFGGGPTNIVPDLAICRCNSRMNREDDMLYLTGKILELVNLENQIEGVNIEYHIDNFRPPKEFDAAHKNLFEDLKQCSMELSKELHWRDSGGVCDGNILAREGITSVDTLGAIGSGIHTYDEMIYLDSLTERAKLCTLFLMKIAARVIDIKRYKPMKDSEERNCHGNKS